MQTYQYSAISKDGAKVSGVIEAFDEFAAVASIKETCSVVTKIQAVEQKGLLTRDVFTPKIKERDLAVMCSQFAIILGAGLPMVRAVELHRPPDGGPPPERTFGSGGRRCGRRREPGPQL